MKTYIIYNSKTGFTERYAKWIAEELGCDAKPYKGFDFASVGEEDVLVFCGRIVAGKIENLKDLKILLGGKPAGNLVVAAVGATPAGSEAAINTIWTNNLTADEMESIPHFYLEGGIDFEKMGFGEKMILKAAVKFLKNKKDKTSEVAALDQAMSGSFDNTTKDNILPITEFVKRLDH